MDDLNREHVTQYWNAVMDRCQVPPDAAREQALEELLSAYEEPSRHYHNLEHIAQVIDVLLAWEYYVKDWDSLFLAAFYHDVVYDSRRNDNEQRSADFAEQAMRLLRFAADRIARVRDLILWTKHHDAPDDDADACLLLGADLSVLGYVPWERYEAYRLAIRKEYAWVPEVDFCTGRRKVLEGFLKRTRIFATEKLGFLEGRARANMAAELAQIDGTLRTLLP